MTVSTLSAEFMTRQRSTRVQYVEGCQDLHGMGKVFILFDFTNNGHLLACCGYDAVLLTLR